MEYTSTGAAAITMFNENKCDCLSPKFVLIEPKILPVEWGLYWIRPIADWVGLDLIEFCWIGDLDWIGLQFDRIIFDWIAI